MQAVPSIMSTQPGSPQSTASHHSDSHPEQQAPVQLCANSTKGTRVHGVNSTL